LVSQQHWELSVHELMVPTINGVAVQYVVIYFLKSAPESGAR